MTQPYQNFINGAFQASSEHLGVFNPATGARLTDVPASDGDDVNRAIEAARAAQKAWAKKPAIERAGYLRKISAKIREHAPRLARIITEEQGKASGLAEVEVNFTADYIDYMAEWARRIEGEIITSDRPNENIFLFRKPLGSRRHPALEFPVLPHCPQDGSSFGNGQHHRHQTQRRNADQLF